MLTLIILMRGDTQLLPAILAEQVGSVAIAGFDFPSK